MKIAGTGKIVVVSSKLVAGACFRSKDRPGGDLIGKEMTMVTRKTAAGQAKGKKHKLKKETIKDLESKKGGEVKGGLKQATVVFCTDNCPTAKGCPPTK
jgi:hypothetical protein